MVDKRGIALVLTKRYTMYVETLRLQDGTELKPGSFNVIIGGNAVGKTTFLMELFDSICAAERPRWYWVDTMSFGSTEVRADVSLLIGSLARHWDGRNVYYYSRAARKPDGDVDLDGNLRFSQSDYTKLKQVLEGDDQSLSENVYNQVKYRRPFVTLLNCETRLSLTSDAPVDGMDRSPQNPLNVLFRDNRLLGEICESIRNQFSLELVLLSHRWSTLDLGLAVQPAPPCDLNAEDRQAEFEKVEAWKTDNFTPLRDIGHGIRSMARILISLLDPVNQVFLIDEPEMHLYPSQKRWIGLELSRLSQRGRKQVFVVTHDPMVLQGVLDNPSSTTIFRIDMDENGERKTKPCTLENISDVGAKRNQDSYLQGLFYQRCIAVEGATDRAFYQTTVEEQFPEVSDKDIGFIACGGKGSSKNVAAIVTRVGLRCAFIYDFDALLVDLGVVRDVYEMLGGDPTRLGELKTLIDSFGTANEVAKKPEIKKAKELGLQSPLARKHRNVFDKSMKALSEFGIFLVPYGSLESWAPAVEPRARFADLAPDAIKARQTLRRRFKQFMKPILRYLGC